MSSDVLSLDFETKSELDLTVVGTDNYVKHSSTTVLMAAFKLNGQDTEQWVPAEGERMPSDLKEALRDPAVTKVGFNASFERRVTNDVLGIPQPYEAWKCSMALAYMFSFMGGLDDIGEQMGLSFRKSPRGKQLVKIFCGPNKPSKNQPYVWRDRHSDPDLWEEFKAYNVRDEDTEWEVWDKLSRFHMPDWQWDLYQLDQIINDRGLPINRTFVENALGIADRRKAELISAQNRITGLANANSGTQLLPWLQERGYPYDNLQKDNFVKALTAEEEEVKNPSQTYDIRLKAFVVPDYKDCHLNGLGQVVGDAVMTNDCRVVMRMRQSSSKTSTAKYSACMDGLGVDDRLRGCFQYAGGSRTNRWAGRKIQPQNLPRTPKWLEPEDYINFDRLDYCNSLIEQNDYLTLGFFAGDQMDAVAGCVRSCIQAPSGFHLVVCDLSSIESVVIGWLTECDRLLNVFWDGRDAYKDFATDFYGVPYDQVTKAQRSICKPAVLGCGYRLSGGQLRDGEKTGLWAYAENMGVKMTQQEATKAVEVFRQTYKEIKDAWYSIEDAIVRAMTNGGKPVKWGPLTFEVKKPFFRVILPSGRPMYYHKLKVESVKMWSDKYEREYFKNVISYMGRHQVTNQWTRIESHGGKFVENFVQAIARDILGFGMLAAHKAGFFICGHVHDEIIAQEKDGDTVHTLALLKDCMTKEIQRLYDWLKSMPLGAAGYEGVVYKKD